MFPKLTQEKLMSALPEQMQANMALRGWAYRTQQSHLESVAKLVRAYDLSRNNGGQV
jgi:hypothetical protein